jgi:hypothetical protein
LQVALNDSASALSALEPIAPEDWGTPASRQASAKARLQYWVSSTGRCNIGLLK